MQQEDLTSVVEGTKEIMSYVMSQASRRERRRLGWMKRTGMRTEEEEEKVSLLRVHQRRGDDGGRRGSDARCISSRLGRMDEEAGNKRWERGRDERALVLMKWKRALMEAR